MSTEQTLDLDDYDSCDVHELTFLLSSSCPECVAQEWLENQSPLAIQALVEAAREVEEEANESDLCPICLQRKEQPHFEKCPIKLLIEALKGLKGET